MFYLITQIIFILAIAIASGLGIGWWIRGKTGPVNGPVPDDSPEDPFDARFRLEQCHRDNAALRRELKDAGERVEKLQSRLGKATTVDNEVMERMERMEACEVRVQALLEDLQLRDDTISILERELETIRRGNT